ncbi:MAG: protein kinase [Sandaracinaceae bacterium]
MKDAQPHGETIEMLVARMASLGATIEQRPTSTIVPNRSDEVAEEALALFHTLDDRVSAKLELHGTLGEGGMGRVRLATQKTLSRPVAVKTLKEEHRSDRATLKLLREAWVTGNLEHPNVVPVYDLALDGDGSPMIVLKKIEGTSWERLIHDAASVRERFGASDLLEWNLRIFMQVCNATYFAHSRHVMHRDLKPENVMIGTFGEVYVVDWGLAVATEDDGTGRVPLAADAHDVAGTPAYMAPEMLGGKLSRLSERTDIYLLGATLYEIVVGHAPHQGETLMEFVAQIVESAPEIGSEVPSELRRVIRRCMDPDPHGRFESAEQVRLAVQGYLQNRDALALAMKADQRRKKLESLIAEERPAREDVYRAFAECRFGYRHALEVWPRHPHAADGLTRATEIMIAYELAHGEVDAAHVLLTELADPDERLAQEVERAYAEKSEEAERLRKLKDDLDPSAGRRTRTFLVAVVGAIWTLFPLAYELARRVGWAPEPTHLLTIVADGVLLVLMVGLWYWARDSMTRTAINRRVAMAGLLAMVGPIVLHGVELVSEGDGIYDAFQYDFLLWMVLGAMASATIDWRFAIPAVAYGVSFALVAFFPELTFVMLFATSLVLVVTMLRLWGQPEDVEGFGARMRERRERRRAWLRRWIGG